MLVKLAKEISQINASEVISTQLKEAQYLQVSSGEIWLTIEGDTQDYVLSQGDSLLLPTGKLIVLQAETTSIHSASPATENCVQWLASSANESNWMEKIRKILNYLGIKDKQTLANSMITCR